MGKKELTKNSAVVFFGTVINSGSVFVFLLLAGRNLPLAKFGELNSLLSIQLVFSVFSGALILYVSRHVASYHALGSMEEIRGFHRYAWKVGLAFAMASGAVLLVSSPYWKEALEVGDYIPVFALVIYISLFFFQGVPLGMVRGMQKFGLLAASLSLAGLFRIGAVIFVVYRGLTVTDALAATSLAVLVSIVLLEGMILRAMGGRWSGWTEPEEEGLSVFLGHALSVTFFPMLFVNMDMLMVRSVFPPDDSGLYAAYTVFGKVIIMGAQVVVVAMFPAAVTGRVLKQGNMEELFFRAVLLTLAGGLVVTAVCYLGGEMLLETLFGITDPGAAAVLPVYTLMAVSVAVLLVEGNYRLAMGKYRLFRLSLAAAVIQVVGVYFSYPSLPMAVSFQAVLFGLFAITVLFRAYAAGRGPGKRGMTGG